MFHQPLSTWSVAAKVRPKSLFIPFLYLPYYRMNGHPSKDQTALKIPLVLTSHPHCQVLKKTLQHGSVLSGYVQPVLHRSELDSSTTRPPQDLYRAIPFPNHPAREVPQGNRAPARDLRAFDATRISWVVLIIPDFSCCKLVAATNTRTRLTKLSNCSRLASSPFIAYVSPTNFGWMFQEYTVCTIPPLRIRSHELFESPRDAFLDRWFLSFLGHHP